MSDTTHAQRLLARFPGLSLFGRSGLFVESLITLTMSVIGLIEGWRLTGDTLLWKDPIGPGWFLVGVSAVLMLVTFIRLWTHKADTVPAAEEQVSDAEASWFGPAAQLLIVFALYTLISPWTGYAIASFIFFIAALHVAGVKLWRNSILIALVLAVVFYGFCFSLDIPIP